MLKRILWFVATNIAFMITISIVMFVINLFFPNALNASTLNSNTNISSIFIYSGIIGFTSAFLSLCFSKQIAKWTTKTQIIQENSMNPMENFLFNTVKQQAGLLGLKMPEVGVYQDDTPNAFATGATKNSSLVAVSSGLLDMMSKDAIEWVVGHEMAHVLNGDMVTMTLLQWVLNTFVVFFSKIIANIVANSVDENYAWIARFAVDILLQIVFGFLASFIAMWFSRYREFKADAGSAYYVWKEKMIAWLQALKDMQNNIAKDDPTYSSMQISSKKTSGFMKLLSSHPDLDDRIKALEDLKM